MKNSQERPAQGWSASGGENKNDKKESGGEWYDKIEGMLGVMVKNVMGGFFDRVRERIHEMIISFQKNLAGTFLLLVGTIFALVGVSIFLNDLLKISGGMGYAIVGVGSMLLGIIIIKK